MATHGWESATKADIKKLLSKAQLRVEATNPKRSKYKAQPVVIDGIRFDSKKEGARYVELKALQKARDITELELQPRFELYAGPIRDIFDKGPCSHTKVGDYVADFRYKRYFKMPDGTDVVQIKIEDVKSPATRTPLYRIKKKLAEACHGITITEV